MARKNIKYKVGDIFLIPSTREGFYVGQIAVDTTSEIGAPFCFIYDGVVSGDVECGAMALDASMIISASLITPELIKYGKWRVCANRQVPKHVALGYLEKSRDSGYVGDAIIGAGLATKYLDTFYGIVDMCHWPDPSYVFDFFLVPMREQSQAQRKKSGSLPDRP